MKKRLLFISPGPSYSAHDAMYQRQYQELSKNYGGYIFTSGSSAETFAIGDFVYMAIKFRNSNLRTVKFVFFCIWNAIKLSVKREEIDLVITYDPLKTGLIGLAISHILKAKFACEVNGVYTSAAQWLDGPKDVVTKIKKQSYIPIMRYVLKHSDGIKLLYAGQIDFLKEVVHYKIIRAFPAFVQIENFKNIRENKEVLFVGFPYKLKGVDILIKAFKKIAHNYPEWKLKILGWYPDPQELNKSIDGHPQIYHHPPVNYNEMPEHMGSCAIFVLPSRSEAMGRVLVEAMAAGKPRIGSNVDGIPTVINDGVDGLLFESENVDDLSDKLDKLMGNPDLRHKLGKAGEMRSKQEFSEENYIKNVTMFYNDVLGVQAGMK